MSLYRMLQEKLGEHNPSEVEELILDDILVGSVPFFSEDNKKDLEKYSNLIRLSLNGVGLESLKNFPRIPSLEVLELRDNSLNGNDFSNIISLFPELFKLKVGKNSIKTIEVFKPLKDSNLRKLELQDTFAAEKSGYIDDLFKMIETLEAINHKTIDGHSLSTTIYDDDNEDQVDEEDQESCEEFDQENEFEEFDDAEEEDEESDRPTKKGKKN